MANTFSKLALTAGSIALALAPVSASAGTRASDNSIVYGESVTQPGVGRSADGEQVAGGVAPFHVVLAIIVGAWATAFVAKSDVFSDDEDDDDDDEFQSAGV
jgi:hypothetical protein